MGFILGIFKFFFIMFLIGMIALAVMLFKGVRMFKKMTKQGNNGQQRQRRTSNYRTTQTSDGVTVEDRRSPDEAQQKIFAPDEGEYVDFKEE